MTARTGLAVLAIAAAAATPAWAQDQTPQTADPVAALDGLWRIDRVEGAGADSAMGRIMRIGRQSIATLTGGTCSNPGFAAQSDGSSTKVTITCIGQALATAEWDPAAPDTVDWSETDVKVVLHRLGGASDAAPPSSGTQQNDQQPNDQQNQQNDQGDQSE